MLNKFLKIILDFLILIVIMRYNFKVQFSCLSSEKNLKVTPKNWQSACLAFVLLSTCLPFFFFKKKSRFEILLKTFLILTLSMLVKKREVLRYKTQLGIFKMIVYRDIDTTWVFLVIGLQVLEFCFQNLFSLVSIY